ncbi:MAG TPA: SelB C-terminal domain-containing protein [Candidatus Nanopelagicaceae bacterium]|nr:SelB C-terminal domain-containing protein [Candidatus Nanopelagicaceae bacterium]
MSELVVGTAGHIDHGKTALITALTGVDCDRLAEERRRGMTIELGFAPWSLPSGREVSVVDVPGHERFIRTMAVGAKSTDLALLCVAADDGIMPQTREHAAILRLLMVRRAVVAVTKIDLAPERAASVGESSLQMLRDLGVSATRWIGVSAPSRLGLDELAAAVDSELAVIQAPADRGHPRLLVDRSFSQVGTGTVVTGVLDGGRLHLGEGVEAFPSRKRGRIQGLQRRGQALTAAEPGGRLALALNGIVVKDVPRGSVIGLTGDANPSSYLDCLLQIPSLGARGVRQAMQLEVLCGTAGVSADLWLVGEERLVPGGSGYAQLHLHSPLWALPGDRLILRTPSPAAVVGGGLVLDAHPARHRRWVRAPLDAWAQRERALAEAGGSGPDQLAVLEASTAPLGLTAKNAARLAGVPESAAATALRAALAAGRLQQVGSRFVAPERWQELVQLTKDELRQHHQSRPLEPGLPRRQLLQRLGFDSSPEGDSVIHRLESEGVLEARGPVVKATGQEPASTPGAAVERISALLRQSGANPPSAGELKQAGMTREVGAYLIRQGEAIQLSGDLLMSAAAFQALESTLRDLLATSPQGVSVAAVRDYLHTSRRVAVPLLERLERSRVTERAGDLHRIRRSNL